MKAVKQRTRGQLTPCWVGVIRRTDRVCPLPSHSPAPTSASPCAHPKGMHLSLLLLANLPGPSGNECSEKSGSFIGNMYTLSGGKKSPSHFLFYFNSMWFQKGMINMFSKFNPVGGLEDLGYVLVCKTSCLERILRQQ